MKRLLIGAAAAALASATLGAMPARAADDRGGQELLDRVPALEGITMPDRLAKLPGGLPNGPDRNYGTPTPAPGKTCPFVGKIPVKVPTVTTPVGTSHPLLRGVRTNAASVDSQVYGELCMSKAALKRAKQGKPPAVLVMVHGITYGTWYWDMPYQPQKYSTVNYLNRHGYATLNIDRIGNGRSGHPLSPLTTATANAETVNQLVTKLRSGQIGDFRYRNVGMVGHSYGTMTGWLESSLYDDLDVNIGTGYSDRVSLLAAGGFAGLSTPASASPLNKNQPWAADPGYLQPLPTARGLPQLYRKQNVDPKIIETDTRLVGTVTAAELATFPPGSYNGQRKNIAVPTFSIQGEYDIMTCGQDAKECATDATESDNPVELERKGARYTKWQSTAFAPKACFRGAVVPNASHNIPLHKNANQFHRQVAFFADQAMGTQGQNVERYKRTCATRGPNAFDSLPELTRLVPAFPTNPPPVAPTVEALLDYLYPKQ